MSGKEIVEKITDTVDNLSYQQASASGGISGLLYEFMQDRSEELLFLFLAGFVGAMGGAFAKWIVNICKRIKDKNGPDKQMVS